MSYNINQLIDFNNQQIEELITNGKINLLTLINNEVKNLKILLEKNNPTMTAKIEELITNGQINLVNFIKSIYDLVKTLQINNRTITAKIEELITNGQNKLLWFIKSIYDLENILKINNRTITAKIEELITNGKINLLWFINNSVLDLVKTLQINNRTITAKIEELITNGKINLLTLINNGVHDLGMTLQINNPIITAKIEELITNGQINLLTLIDNDVYHLKIILERTNPTIAAKIEELITNGQINLVNFINNSVHKLETILKINNRTITAKIEELITNGQINLVNFINIYINNIYINDLETILEINNPIITAKIEELITNGQINLVNFINNSVHKLETILKINNRTITAKIEELIANGQINLIKLIKTIDDLENILEIKNPTITAKIEQLMIKDELKLTISAIGTLLRKKSSIIKIEEWITKDQIKLSTLIKGVADLEALLRLNNPAINEKIEELITKGEILRMKSHELVNSLKLNNSIMTYKALSYIPKEVINLCNKVYNVIEGDNQQLIIELKSILSETRESIEKRKREIINSSNKQDLNIRKEYNILSSESLSSVIDQLEYLIAEDDIDVDNIDTEGFMEILDDMLYEIFRINNILSNEPSEIKDIPKSQEESEKEIEKNAALTVALHEAFDYNLSNTLLDEPIRRKIISAIELGADPNIPAPFYVDIVVPGLHGVAMVLNTFSSKQYMLEVANILASYGADPYFENYEGKNAFKYIKDEKVNNRFKEKIEQGQLEYEKSIKPRLEFIRKLNEDKFKIDFESLQNKDIRNLHAEVVQNKINEICEEAESLLEFYGKENLRKGGPALKLEQYETKLNNLKTDLEKVEDFQKIDMEIRLKLAKLTSFESNRKIIQQKLTEYSEKLSKYIKDIESLNLDENYMNSLKKSLNKIDAEILKFKMKIKDVTRELYMDGIEPKRSRENL